jgi:hypothetical protein
MLNLLHLKILSDMVSQPASGDASQTYREYAISRGKADGGQGSTPFRKRRRNPPSRGFLAPAGCSGLAGPFAPVMVSTRDRYLVLAVTSLLVNPVPGFHGPFGPV